MRQWRLALPDVSFAAAVVSQIVPGGDISNFLQKLSVALALSKTIPGLFTGTEPNHLQRLSMEVRGAAA